MTYATQAEKRHLTFGPDPATHNRNTFGGMIGNNSCGMHAQMAGKTEENVEELEIVTYDGLRMRVGRRPTRSSNASSQRAVAAARSTRNYGPCAINTPTRSAPVSRRFRAGSRAFRSTNSCPRTDSTWLAPWSARRAPASPSSRRRCASCRARRIACSRCWDFPTSRPPVTMCRSAIRHQPIALEGMAESMFHYMELKGDLRRRAARCSPMASAGSSASSAATLKKKRRNARAA